MLKVLIPRRLTKRISPFWQGRLNTGLGSNVTFRNFQSKNYVRIPSVSGKEREGEITQPIAVFGLLANV